MRRRTLLASVPAATVLPATVLPATAGPGRRTVLELFTSQGCSSCPPADALLTELARRSDLLPLAFHVTYWDRLGWRDPFSLEEATARQRRYATWLHADSIYTPQLVVDGQIDVVGSDRAGVLRAIEQSRATQAVALELGQSRASVGAGPGGTIQFIGYDREHRTAVGRGENGGRTLLESNIVRSLHTVAWDGGATHLPAPDIAGEHVAVLVQGRDGTMLASAAL